MVDRLTIPVVLLLDEVEIARVLQRQVLEPAGFEIVEAEDRPTRPKLLPFGCLASLFSKLIALAA